MKIALASPLFPLSVNDALAQMEKLVSDASHRQAEIICFPESFIPGYPADEFRPEKLNAEQWEATLQKACAIARQYSMTTILPMDWYSPGEIAEPGFCDIEQRSGSGLPNQKST